MLVGVAQADVELSRAVLLEKGLRLAMNFGSRFSTVFSHNLHVAPAKRLTDTGAERFGDSFLGGEAGGDVGGGVGVA